MRRHEMGPYYRDLVLAEPRMIRKLIERQLDALAETYALARHNSL